VLFMLIAAVPLRGADRAARDAKREQRAGAGRGPKGAANVVEAIVLFIRDEIALKNIGHGGERFVPYIVTVFFFILFCNLLGLVPWGASPTGNICRSRRARDHHVHDRSRCGHAGSGAKGYLQTIFYAPHGMHWA
jgi:F-type H+-transporting ATPase subunit a